jgi:hypothetical protein
LQIYKKNVKQENGIGVFFSNYFVLEEKKKERKREMGAL